MPVLHGWDFSRMSVSHIEFIVEEQSQEEVLRQLLPRMLGGLSFEVYSHLCKDDLLKRLPERLRGYAHWLPPDWRIVVLVDRDDDDCEELKGRLEAMAREAGLVTKTAAGGGTFAVVNRIVIQELEAWYFGDWEAVREVYRGVSATVPEQARYRHPDEIRGGTWEAFERLLQGHGYFKSGLRKLEAARTIGARMDPQRNRSHSFRVFRDTLEALIAEA
jgi:hypothetical protein